MSTEIRNKTLYRQLDKAGIQDVILCKGKGYFYIASDNDTMADRISRLNSNMIYCNSFCDQPIECWVKDILDLLNTSYLCKKNKP